MNTAYRIRHSEALDGECRRYIPGGAQHNYHVISQTPQIYIDRASGSRCWDVDNNEYLDLAAQSGAMLLGHHYDPFFQKILEALQKPSAVGITTDAIACAENLSRYIPCCDMVRFGLSGTEVVQNALRLARAYTKRNLVIKFRGHYHGSADSIMINKSDDCYIPYDDGEGIFSTEGRDDTSLKNLLLLPWNQSAVLHEVLSVYSDRIAAIIMEPICMNGGGILPKEGYLQTVREECTKHGIVLIFDEIITGLRMGLGGAQTYFGVTPDLCLLGKSIGGGCFPISAICGRREIMQLYEQARVVHAGTFNGYPLGMAAIRATLDILSENGTMLYRNMEIRENQIHEVFMEQARNSNIELVIQGVSGCFVMHNSSHILEDSREFNSSLMQKDSILWECLQRHGVLLASPSKMYPNITLNGSDVDFLADRIQKSFTLAATILERIKKKNVEADCIQS